jgi:hypothetical protein
MPLRRDSGSESRASIETHSDASGSSPGGPVRLFSSRPVWFATIDYFSSSWAGWNDSKGDRSRNQTDRITAFLRRYHGYGSKERQIAVNVWRHKLMHTGEPRGLRNSAINEVYWREIDANGQNHMTLVPIDTAGNFSIQLNPFAPVRDLHRGVLDPNGDLDELRQSADLQQKFLSCFHEMGNYSISLKP